MESPHLHTYTRQPETVKEMWSDIFNILIDSISGTLSKLISMEEKCI